MNRKTFHIIGVCSGWGAQIRGCERGPEALLERKIFERLQREGVTIAAIEMIYPKVQAFEEEIALEDSLPLIKDVNGQLSKAVHTALAIGHYPIVIGGDHSIAVGTWSAYKKPFGLLWMDAHMDAHTAETSPSGAYHGMPVAELLQGPLRSSDLATIGIRSFEKEEAAFLEKRNVKIYSQDEVERRGLADILPEAIAHITKHTPYYGVSLDLDLFDPLEAPGVGSPEVKGIKQKEFLPLIKFFRDDERCRGLEIVEYNPERDVDHKTEELIYKILYEVMRP